MFKKLATLIGVVFLLVGILGFVPGVTTSDDLLLGIFKVGFLQNLIHILGGIAALVATKSEEYSKLYFKIFGVIYALVAVAGVVQGDTVLGLFAVNAAENILHVVLALAFLAIGFGMSSTSTTTPARPTTV